MGEIDGSHKKMTNILRVRVNASARGVGERARRAYKSLSALWETGFLEVFLGAHSRPPSFSASLREARESWAPVTRRVLRPLVTRTKMFLSSTPTSLTSILDSRELSQNFISGSLILMMSFFVVGGGDEHCPPASRQAWVRGEHFS